MSKNLYYLCPRCNTTWQDSYKKEYGLVTDDCPACQLRHVNPCKNLAARKIAVLKRLLKEKKLSDKELNLLCIAVATYLELGPENMKNEKRLQKIIDKMKF